MLQTLFIYKFHCDVAECGAVWVGNPGQALLEVWLFARNAGWSRPYDMTSAVSGPHYCLMHSEG